MKGSFSSNGIATHMLRTTGQIQHSNLQAINPRSSEATCLPQEAHYIKMHAAMILR